MGVCQGWSLRKVTEALAPGYPKLCSPGAGLSCHPVEGARANRWVTQTLLHGAFPPEGFLKAKCLPPARGHLPQSWMHMPTPRPAVHAASPCQALGREG